MKSSWKDPSVWVGGLGYFVDTYDLVLFSVVRKASLAALAVPPEQQLPVGLHLLDMQMLGMLLGGLIWGFLGDRVGRRTVLFGSILLYSLANIANGMVHDTGSYAFWRLLAGFGLAGELGAAITLVCERLSSQNRGYGTMVVAGIGVSGATLAAVTGEMTDWRTAYFLGGGLGLVLLLLRFGTRESEMFRAIDPERRASLGLLVRSWRLLGRYLCCVTIGIPIWCVVAVFVNVAPEMAEQLQVTGPISTATAVFFLYAGAALGDFGAGWLSQIWKSRKRTIATCLASLSLFTVVMLTLRGLTPGGMKLLYFALGLATGYWSVFVTMTAEQFGTNLRSTATTTAPNVVRGTVVLINGAFLPLKDHLGLVQAAAIVCVICFGGAMLALRRLPETYGKDLEYLES